jgi:hypothetical protein
VTGGGRLQRWASRPWLVSAAGGLLVALALGACGGTRSGTGDERLSVGVARTQVLEHVGLGGGVTYHLQTRSWAYRSMSGFRSGVGLLSDSVVRP